MGSVIAVTKSGDYYRAQARAARQRSVDSFDRCDTDGFLTQWASDTNAQLYDLAARVADNGGMWEFPALFDLDGQLVSGAVEVPTRWGYAWKIPAADGGETWFNPSAARKAAKRQATDAGKGYQLGTIRQRAIVMLTGVSATSVHPVVRPDRYSAAEIVSVADYTDEGTDDQLCRGCEIDGIALDEIRRNNGLCDDCASPEIGEQPC